MKNLKIIVNGTSYDVQVEELSSASSVNSAPTPVAPTPVATPKPVVFASPAGSVAVKAPMPGTVVNVVVSVGQSVKSGDDLVFIEAMKMETPVKAPQDGKIATVEVTKGESVDSGKVLVTLD